jgi:hypothetical protein
MESVPFSIADVYGGLADCQGIVSATESCLVLEFETRDSVFGVLKSGVKSVEIPFSELESVTYEKRLFSALIRICVRRLSTVADIPGLSNGEIKLKVARKNRSKAKLFASSVNLHAIELSLESIRQESNHSA